MYFFSSIMNKSPKRKKKKTVSGWTSDRNKEELQNEKSENYKTLTLKAQLYPNTLYKILTSLQGPLWPISNFHLQLYPATLLLIHGCKPTDLYVPERYQTHSCLRAFALAVTSTWYTLVRSLYVWLFVIIQVAAQIKLNQRGPFRPIHLKKALHIQSVSITSCFLIALITIWNYIYSCFPF